MISNFSGAGLVFGLPHLVIAVFALMSGVCTAIAAYFWLHNDTNLTRTQMWEHIWGLLTFFVGGFLTGGLLATIFLLLLGGI